MAVDLGGTEGRMSGEYEQNMLYGIIKELMKIIH